MIIVRHLMLLTSLLCPNVAEHEIDGHSVNPARQRRIAAPRVESLPDVNEHVLRQIGGALPRPTHPETQREDSRRMRAVQLFERGFVTGCRTTGERALAIVIVRDQLQPSSHVPN